MTPPDGRAAPDGEAVAPAALLAALKASEERLSFALDATADGVWDWDFVSGAVVFNARWAAMLGYDPAELEPHIRTWERLAHPDDVPIAYAQLEAHAAGRLPQVQFEMRMRHHDGSWRWILNRAKIVARGADGSILRVVGTHTDIHDAKLQAARLAEQTTLLETILATIPIAIDIVGVDGRISYVNRAWERILGWTMAELGDADDFAKFYPDPAVREAVLRSVGDGSPVWRDWTVRTRDGRDVEMSWSNAKLADGRIVGMGVDVTSRRAAERERKRLEQQLQEAQKLESLGVLAGGIAHDFNNLLVGVLGNASHIEDTLAADSPLRPLIAELRVAGLRAAELTQQLLDYAGKGRFVTGPTDVSAIVEEMQVLLRAVISKGATVEALLPDDLPAIEADASQLRQVVMNLITNASDALGDAAGVIRLRTGRCVPSDDFRRRAVGGRELGPGEHVFIEVADTGAGMSEETRRRIFDPFFTTKFTGRGLGLAATLGIVRAHRGALLVESRLGHGTTFRLVFPASVQSVGSSAGSAPVGSIEHSGTVLVADDEAIVRTVTARMLRRMGFSVVEAADGEAAVEAVRVASPPFRLVVLDLTMPVLSGRAALQQLRRIDPTLPVVICSGYTEDAIASDDVQGGVIEFVQKPFTTAALTAAVGRLLGAASGRGASPPPRDHDGT